MKLARCTVIPAKAGIQTALDAPCRKKLDPRLRGDDGVEECVTSH
jgi:hypothetical protein